MTHRSDIYLANIIFPLHTWLFCVQCTVQSTGVQLFPLICVCREIVPANGHDLPTKDETGMLTGPSLVVICTEYVYICTVARCVQRSAAWILDAKWLARMQGRSGLST